MADVKFIQVVYHLGDTIDEDGIRHDGTESIECKDFNELHQALLTCSRDLKVDHVHLVFRDKNHYYLNEIAVPITGGIKSYNTFKPRQ